MILQQKLPVFQAKLFFLDPKTAQLEALLYPRCSRVSCFKFINACIKKCHIKFVYSEKATKFCEISTLLLSYVVPIKSKVEISQYFVAFSQYMNFYNPAGWANEVQILSVVHSQELSIKLKSSFKLFHKDNFITR